MIMLAALAMNIGHPGLVFDPRKKDSFATTTGVKNTDYTSSEENKTSTSV